MVSASVVAACTLVPLTLMGCGSGGPDAATSVTAPLDVKMCTKDGCKPSTKRVALDMKNPELQSLLSTSKDAVTLKYQTGKGGPRLYLIEEEGTNKNMMFNLQEQEFSFDVDLSSMGCGFNAALYLVGMNENEGKAETGANYCDANAVAGVYCPQMNLFEGNAAAHQWTTRGCKDACASFTEGVDQCIKGATGEKTVCDHNGCNMNPFRFGPGTTEDEEKSNWDWYGSGASFALDASKPFTVTTQFQSKAKIARFYMQGGKRIDLPTMYVIPSEDGTRKGLTNPSIGDEFCKGAGDEWLGSHNKTATSQMWDNLQSGMVLAMSTWYDKETYINGQLADNTSSTGMSWLDGINPWATVGPCNQTTSDTGDHQATFSNIRFGPLGTTNSEQEFTIV